MSWSFVTERLRSARNYWLATVRPDKRPHSVPVWGVFVADDFLFETTPSTRKARNLALNPAVVLHTESGEEVVIVEGNAKQFAPPREAGQRIARAFAQKYEGYEPDPGDWAGGGLYWVEPTTVFAWRDMPTATCWRFR